MQLQHIFIRRVIESDEELSDNDTTASPTVGAAAADAHHLLALCLFSPTLAS